MVSVALALSVTPLLVLEGVKSVNYVKIRTASTTVHVISVNKFIAMENVIFIVLFIFIGF